MELNGGMADELGGNCSTVIEVLSRLRKTKESLRRAGVSPDFRTEHSPNTCHELYHRNNLLAYLHRS
jgi:hypothetical protein